MKLVTSIKISKLKPLLVIASFSLVVRIGVPMVAISVVAIYVKELLCKYKG